MNDHPHDYGCGSPREAKSWAAFDRQVRHKGYKLLARLGQFRNPVLVSGCQRSGTTMLSRVISQAKGISNPWTMVDHELETANALCGAIPLKAGARFCFQTTYLNDRLPEYFEHDNYQLIWVLRNPFSVVHSMLTHWKRSSLNRLFRAVGHLEMNEPQMLRYHRFGAYGLSRVEKACLSYNAKVKQIHVLRQVLPESRLLLVDYDGLVADRDFLFPKLFRFLELDYTADLCSSVRSDSRARAAGQRDSVARTVQQVCGPVFEEAYAQVQIGTARS